MGLSDLVIPPWVKVALRLAPYLAIVGLLAGLYVTRATLHQVRVTDELVAVQTQLETTKQSLSWTKQLSDAQSGYSQTLLDLSKQKFKSDEDTKAFAATPAGSVPCLALDRVRGILQNRAAVEAAVAPKRSPDSVPASGDPSTGLGSR